MPDPSYRLANHQSRPPPLQFNTPSSKTSRYSGSHDTAPPLLYDLPASPFSPPTSPFSTNHGIPPTSPSSPRSRPPLAKRNTSSSRNRSVTPPRTAPGDIEKFADHCKAWYFSQDEEAGRFMTQTLANIPPSLRATYSRIQASTRSAYHRSVNVRRAAEFRAHLSATQPGGSLTAHARAHPKGSEATKERLERFGRFLRAWCNGGMPGPQPFFKSLFAMFTLQTQGEATGGAGGRRIEWEFDDAVFKEAAGKDFMLEAIDMLKGVLGCEEYLSPSLSPYPSRESWNPPHARSQSQPLSADLRATPTATRPKRARAPSDPFLDTPSTPALSRSVGTASSQSSGMLYNPPDEPTSPLGSSSPGDPSRVKQQRRVSRPDLSVEDLEDASLRTWIAPDLPDAELLGLLALFPAFVAAHTVPRFPVGAQTKPSDLEQGLAAEVTEEKQIRFGTGVLWVGPRHRSEGWRVTWWTRLTLWLKRTFF